MRSSPQQFVSLAAISDPSLVPVSIAQSVGLQDARGRSLLEHLSGYVGDSDVLLVLDNFEQVLAAGEFVSELLDGESLHNRIGGRPITVDHLLDYAVQQRAEPSLLDALRGVPDRTYESLDEVTEVLLHVQPVYFEELPAPREESGSPPGGDRYT